MLCKPGDEKDLNRKWIFQPKLDGTRAICYFENNKFKLINRRNINITHRYPELKINIKAKNAVIDGEIIIFDKKKVPSFSLLQMREHLIEKEKIIKRSKELPANYVIFDIVYLDGKDLSSKNLIERERILRKAVKKTKNSGVIFSTKDGKGLWKDVKRKNMEGVIAKDPNSRYFSGKRVNEWIKIKFLKTIEALIVGFTQEKRKLSALALGAYNKNKLIYIGRVGTGFNHKFINEFSEKLEKIKTNKPSVEFKGSKKIIWVKPKYIAEIRFLDITKDKQLRAPAFLRLREDKKLKECII